MVDDSTKFPEYPEHSLSETEVRTYLLELKEAGWQILKKQDAYCIIENEAYELWIRPKDAEEWEISTRYTGSANRYNVLSRRVKSAREMEQVLDGRLKSKKPVRVRLEKSKPASNYSNLASLIGSRPINAVWDPYLDNDGLDSIRTLCFLGVQLGDHLRLVTGKPDRLTEQYVESFFLEFSCSKLAVRVAQGEHRRFMLLGGHSLIMGGSLNGINKNEAARLEDDKLDKPFFDKIWDTSKEIYHYP